MNKKVLSLLLAILLLTTTIFSNVAAAQNLPIMRVEAVNGYASETVDVSVVLEDNPGFSTASVKIDYDSTRVELLNAKLGDEFASGANVSYDNLPYLTFVKSNDTTDLNFLTLTFKILENASAGDAYITIIYDEGDISNKSEADVNFQVVDGKITVKVKPVAATGVSLNKETLSLNTGESETLIATVSPDNATNKTVNWKSSDTIVATVDNNGKVTAVKKGTATITVTTEDGNFTDTCNVSIACSHTNTTVHPANESTCLVQGNAEYTTCDDCGIVVSGSDAKLPFGGHKGGTTTCKEKAICTVCSQPYGNYANHNLTNHSRNEADHNNTGNIEYWTCDVCGKYFSDAKGTTVITQADTVIAKVPHSHSTDWSKSDTQHWRECGCGNKIEIDTHKYTNDCDTSCNVCGYTRTITHDWNTTYSTDNNGHWIECKECGEKKDEGTHKGGTATCKDKAVCVVCDKAYGDLALHDMKETVDATYLKSEANCVAKAVYYKSCSVCDTASTDTFETGKVASSTHTGKIEVKDAVKETCTADGYSGDVYCKDCGVKLEDGKVVPMGHKTIKVNAVSATQEKDGNIEYFVCSGCDKLFAEKDATKEITLADTIIKKQEVHADNKLDDEKTESPKTYDSSMYIIWAALLLICISVFVGMKTHNKKEKKF